MFTFEVSRIRVGKCDHVYTVSIPQGSNMERITAALDNECRKACRTCRAER